MDKDQLQLKPRLLIHATLHIFWRQLETIPLKTTFFQWVSSVYLYSQSQKSHTALMVTSTLEINNSVCLNPGKKADTVLQDFLTNFDGAELLQIQRRSSLFPLFSGNIADPKVTSSHRIPDSNNGIVIAHYQSSVLAIHMDITVHVLNGLQLTNLRIVCRLQ